MSPSSDVRLRTIFTWLFVNLILFGIGLRAWELFHIPYGLDADQAQVLYWGRHAVQNSQFAVYAIEATRFEALSAYLFHFSEEWFGDARVLSLIFSLLDMLLLALLLKKRGRDTFLIAAAVALLATSPFAVYYGRIAGPCVGVSTLLLGYYFLPNPVTRALGMGLGLLYYSMFRLLAVFEIFAAVIRKDLKRMLSAAAGVAVLLLLSLVTGDMSSESQLRGLYNFDLSPAELLVRTGEAIRIWFWSPSSRMILPSKQFIIDPVTQGFAWVLGTAPALGVGLAILLLLALVQLATDLLKTKKWESLRALSPETKFTLFVMAALALSPTYSHAFFVLPLVIALVITGFESVILRSDKVKLAFACAVLVAGVSGLTQSFAELAGLKTPGQFDQVFADRLQNVFEKHIRPDMDNRPVFIFTAQQFYPARYLTEKYQASEPRPRFTAQALPGLELEFAMNVVRNSVLPGQSVIVYFVMQEIDMYWNEDPMYLSQQAKVNAIEDRLRKTGNVLSLEELSAFQQSVVRRYVLSF